MIEIIKRNRQRLKEAWSYGKYPATWGAMDYEINLQILLEEFMTNYISEAVRTCSPYTDEVKTRMISEMGLMHGVMGICGEAGEIMELVKKYVFYNKSFDIDALKEELGDLLWYMAQICEAGGFTFEELMDLNIKKLRARYPHKFNTEGAIDRNLDKEKEAMNATS